MGIKQIVFLFLFPLLSFASTLPPTCVQGSGDATCITTFSQIYPNIPWTHSGSTATIGAIPNAGLANSSTAVNGQTCSLGGTCTLNLTGPITSVGNATSIAAQTGTGSVFAVQTTPTFVTSVTDPLLIGGTGTGSSLSLQSTSGSGTTDFVRLLVGNNGAKEALRVVSGGNIGIGTTAPDSPLTISSNTAALPTPTAGTMLHLAAADSVATRLFLDAFGGTPVVNFNQSAGTAANPSHLTSGTNMGQFGFGGYGSTAYIAAAAANIRVTAAEDWSDTTGAAFITFATRPSSSTTAAVERLRIDKNGNVGIGSTSPTNLLVVNGTIQSLSGGIQYPDSSTQASAFVKVFPTTMGNTSIGPGSTVYCYPGNACGLLQTVEARAQSVMPVAATIKNFYCNTSNAQPGDGSLTITLRNNGSATSLVSTVTAGAAAGVFSDTTHSASVSVGDLLSLQVTNASGTSGSAALIGCNAVY